MERKDVLVRRLNVERNTVSVSMLGRHVVKTASARIV